jgi:hypothetical protein
MSFVIAQSYDPNALGKSLSYRAPRYSLVLRKLRRDRRVKMFYIASGVLFFHLGGHPRLPCGSCCGPRPPNCAVPCRTTRPQLLKQHESVVRSPNGPTLPTMRDQSTKVHVFYREICQDVHAVLTLDMILYLGRAFCHPCVREHCGEPGRRPDPHHPLSWKFSFFGSGHANLLEWRQTKWLFWLPTSLLKPFCTGC